MAGLDIYEPDCCFQACVSNTNSCEAQQAVEAKKIGS